MKELYEAHLKEIEDRSQKIQNWITEKAVLCREQESLIRFLIEEADDSRSRLINYIVALELQVESLGETPVKMNE